MIRSLVNIIFIVLPVSFATAQTQFQRGVLWEDNRYNSLPVRYANAGSFPLSKSLKSFYPKVVIQPKEDYTDVAWAAVWNARTAAEAIACNESNPVRIRDMAFAPAYNYTIARKQPNCFEPVSMIEVLESMVRNGSPYFLEFREFCVTDIPVEIVPLATTKKLSGYFKLFNTSDAADLKIKSIKGAILSNNAVLAGIICPPSFNMAADVWTPRETRIEQQSGGHAVCVVGYDDSKFGGAFEIVNTWGKDWGNDGYTWVRYKDFADYVQYGFGLFQVGSAVCDIPFKASVVFKTLGGEEMRAQPDDSPGKYKFWSSYPTGTTFTIDMKTSRPAYVYSFGVDPGNDQFPLFPRLSTTTPVTFTALRAPDDMPAITLTDPAGKNNVFFIFSPYEIDLGKVLSKLKNRRGLSIPDVNAAIASNNTRGELRWDQKGLGFSGSLSAPVVIQVLLEQTRK